jgi:hypothetical protein
VHNVSYYSEFVKINENIDDLCAKSSCDCIVMFYIVICILINAVLLCCICIIVLNLILSSFSHCVRILSSILLKTKLLCVLLVDYVYLELHCDTKFIFSA